MQLAGIMWDAILKTLKFITKIESFKQKEWPN